jgi:hypothetical protein
MTNIADVHLEEADRVLDVVDSMPAALVAEAARVLAADQELAGVGIALGQMGAGAVRRLGLARALKLLALPPYDDTLAAGLVASQEPLWQAIGAAIEAVRASWVALGGL